LKITTESLPERQVLLQIEVDEERHNKAVEKAFRKLAPRVRIPGFRPGKAPRPLIERQIGRHRLLDEAIDILVPEVYREAIETEDLDPVDQPQLEIVSHEPFVFKATVPLRPTVELGDYAEKLRLPRDKVEVTEEQVEESITALRRRYGTVEPVDRAAEKGDIIRGNLKAEVEDRVLFEQDEIEYRLTDESLASLPGLADSIVGLSKGADTTAEFAVPEDFQDERLAGKTAKYHIVVHDVKEEKLATLDDSFAKEVGEGFESLAALRERIRSDLHTAEEDAALHHYHDAAIDALVELATVEYPGVLVEREIDRTLEEQANLDPRDPRAQELYIARLGKSEEEVRDEVREAAELRLRRSLVLGRFAETENIRVEPEDVDNEIQTMASSAGEQADAVVRIFDTEHGRESIRRTLLTRKTLERLVEIASSGNAAAEEPAKPAKRRRSSPRKGEEEAE
jgi:trigger factor